MKHGFIAPKIETHEQGIHHVLGTEKIPYPVINPTGDYLAFLPDREPQSKNGVETFACAVYNTLNSIETQIKYLTGEPVNYSDRFVANLAKQKGILNPLQGSDPHQIAELIRNVTGNINESSLPWTDDITSSTQYYSAVISSALLALGTDWFKTWRLTHRWIFTSGTPQEKRDKIKDALTKGTVSVSVSAWSSNGTLYYKPEGATDNHWTSLVQANGNDPYKIFDSYDTFVKDLDPLYDFGFAKVYFVRPSHIFLKNLGFQTTDPEVAHLQRALRCLGYSIPHAVTNVYGTETRSAVWQFQVANGIADDGSHFGPQTRFKLNQALNPLGVLGDMVTLIRTYLGV